MVELIESKDSTVNKIKSAGIHPDYIDSSVSSFNTEIYSIYQNRKIAQIAKTNAQSWVDDFESNFEKSKVLIINSASVGSGKTKLVSAIFNDLIRTAKLEKGYYQTELKIFEMCRLFSKIDRKNIKKQQLNITSTPVLFIDDFMSTCLSHDLSIAYNEILNCRYSNNSFTILTTMFSKEELVNQLKKEIALQNIIINASEIVLPSEDIRRVLSEIVNFRLQKLLFV